MDADSGAYHWTITRDGNPIDNGSGLFDPDPDGYWASKYELAAGGALYTLTLTKDGEDCERQIQFIVLGARLAVYKIDHNSANGELPDDQKLSLGAFVPINNDDDEGDGLLDKDENWPSDEEDELLPIVLHQENPTTAGGMYTLQIPDPTNLRIWQYDENANLWNLVEATTEFDAANDTTLYVEGRATGTYSIKLDWNSGNGTKIQGCDEVPVNVFNWLGPLNVPDYSKHRYTADSVSGSSKWLSPSGGSITAGANTSDIKSLWGEGPTVGKAIYQATTDYIWDLKVNVVKVSIGPPDAPDQPFTTGVSSETGQTIHDSSNVILKAIRGGNTVGIVWRAKVTLSGPDGQRGVSNIKIGPIQTLKFTSLKGTYDTVGKDLVSSVQGDYAYVDVASSGTGPYYSTASSSVFLDASPDSPSSRTKTIAAMDSPVYGPPLTFQQRKVNESIQPDDDIVDSVSIVWNFNIYITARTTDTQNGADQIYTSRASADWSWNGDGIVGHEAPYVWTTSKEIPSQTITSASSWTPVVSGEEPPGIHTSWPHALEAVKSSTWSPR